MTALSPFRFTWRTRPPEGPRTVETPPLHLLSADWAAAERHGEVFRGARVEYGLTLGEVAQGWGISLVEVSELERGLRRFLSPADLDAALRQLWCWGVEKAPSTLPK